ncbi:MAG: hypothetical protein ACREPY_15760 [Rhodanobacteraceae bacterium]
MQLRRIRTFWWLSIAAIALVLSGTVSASAHAIAGQRLFPSTLTFDDPGIGAEMPWVFNHINVDGLEQNDLGFSVTKPITQRFSLIGGTDYFGQTGGGLPPVHGLDNFTLGAVWQAYVDPSTESIGSFEINRTFAHTGSRAVRAGYSTWSPQFNFGPGARVCARQLVTPVRGERGDWAGPAE